MRLYLNRNTETTQNISVFFVIIALIAYVITSITLLISLVDAETVINMSLVRVNTILTTLVGSVVTLSLGIEKGIIAVRGYHPKDPKELAEKLGFLYILAFIIMGLASIAVWIFLDGNVKLQEVIEKPTLAFISIGAVIVSSFFTTYRSNNRINNRKIMKINHPSPGDQTSNLVYEESSSNELLNSDLIYVLDKEPEGNVYLKIMHYPEQEWNFQISTDQNNNYIITVQIDGEADTSTNPTSSWKPLGINKGILGYGIISLEVTSPGGKKRKGTVPAVDITGGSS